MYVHSAHHFAHIAKFEALAYISPGDSNDPTAPASESRTGSTPIRPFSSFCQSSCSTSFTLQSGTITHMKSQIHYRNQFKVQNNPHFPSPCESIHYSNTVSCLPKEAQLQVTKLHLEKSGTNRKVESWTQNLSVSKPNLNSTRKLKAQT